MENKERVYCLFYARQASLIGFLYENERWKRMSKLEVLDDEDKKGVWSWWKGVISYDICTQLLDVCVISEDEIIDFNCNEVDFVESSSLSVACIEECISDFGLMEVKELYLCFEGILPYLRNSSVENLSPVVQSLKSKGNCAFISFSSNTTLILNELIMKRFLSDYKVLLHWDVLLQRGIEKFLYSLIPFMKQEKKKFIISNKSVEILFEARKSANRDVEAIIECLKKMREENVITIRESYKDDETLNDFLVRLLQDVSHGYQFVVIVANLKFANELSERFKESAHAFLTLNEKYVLEEWNASTESSEYSSNGTILDCKKVECGWDSIN